MQILDGKSYSKEIGETLKKEISELENTLKLVVILVGDNEASKIYVRNKEKKANLLGIDFELIKYSNDVSEDEIISKIEELNLDPKVTSILVQLPLPIHLNERNILEKINYLKDADGLTSHNIGNLLLDKEGIISCTPKGIVELLKHYDIPLEGNNAVVIGRSNIVGKPISYLLLKENATVTMCHSKTKNLAHFTKEADILVVAVGKSKFIKADMIKDGAVIVDVGINREDGKLTGDVDFEEVKDKCSYITPVPGGVGPMTVIMLYDNVLNCFKLQKNKS